MDVESTSSRGANGASPDRYDSGHRGGYSHRDRDDYSRDGAEDSAPASPAGRGDDDDDDMDGSSDNSSEGSGEGEREMDVDDEIDELLSDDGGRVQHSRRAGRGGDGDDDDEDEGGGDGDGDGDDGGDDVPRTKSGKVRYPETTECQWDDCEMVLPSQEELVSHVTQAHVGSGRQPYACLWRTCNRQGQKQASRHALLTHIRSHTGERPYACPEPGCGRQFTRSDAMNKHVRAIHGAAGKKRRGRGGGDDTVAGSSTHGGDGEPSTADRDLAKDEDLAEVVLRVHARDRIQFTAPRGTDEELAVRYVRERRPGGLPSRRGKGGGRGRRKQVNGGANGTAEEDSDDFDEGASKRYTNERTMEGYMVDPQSGGETEIPVMGRSKWQAKYIMAKAKLMLVDEENKMRRDELAFWLAEEERVFGRDGDEGL